MLVAVGSAVVAALLATGALLLMHGFPRKKADRRGLAGRAVNLDAVPTTARVVSTGSAPPQQSGLGKLPTIRDDTPAKPGPSDAPGGGPTGGRGRRTP